MTLFETTGQAGEGTAQSTALKALSLRQPWASLMAIGAKRNETRGWCTKHRGWVAIHAAGRMDDCEMDTALDPWFIEALAPHYRKPPEDDVRYIGDDLTLREPTREELRVASEIQEIAKIIRGVQSFVKRQAAKLS
ncbi:MAG: hypothetical protein MOB07_24290 [Acidobacteria bacterium]|nr:hypothetical protein [Acidobacteriota bacterium]